MTEQFIITLIDKFEAGSMRELEVSDGASRLALSKNFGALLSAPEHGGFNAANKPKARQESTGAAGTPGTVPLTQDELDKTLNGGGTHAAMGNGGTLGNGGGGAGEQPAVITSPIVGTFYASPGPDSPAFVVKGSKVKKGGTLCILEAMKMMNKLEAEFDCEILDIKVQPGQLVEFGQILFEARRL
jgi:acetyl-CoA carboxylase biotin carboxyl carrier protein